MSKTFLGDVCAYIPKQPGMNKSFYPRVGSAFIDNTTEQISIKIDSIPIAQSAWEGWLNVFPPKEGQERAPARAKPGLPMSHFTDMDDDIPF